VGSGCFATIAYVEAIKLARRVFDEAEKQGFNLSLLDLGGVCASIFDCEIHSLP
jgi:diaminopimelate decarboxylase